LSLFASDGFRDPLYRQALLTDFTLPKRVRRTDAQTARQWQQWRDSYSGASPWFSYVSFNGTNVSSRLANTPDFTSRYQQGAQRLDNTLGQMLDTLRARGDLDNTVVIITAATGVELDDNGSGRRESGTRFNRAQLQVPLVVHWPGTQAQVVTKLTNHNDVTVTLIQRLLHASNRASDYSQGEDLFAPRRRNDWVLSADRHQLAITTPHETLLLENNGSYRTLDVNGKELYQQKPQLTLLLQVLTNEKRFIAN
ncbi:hypothetical protein D8L93_09770, partial [Sodalis-like symbiont of Bactericera trigonica]